MTRNILCLVFILLIGSRHQARGLVLPSTDANFSNKFWNLAAAKQDTLPTEIQLPLNTNGANPPASSEPRFEKAKILFPGASAPREVTLEIRDGRVFWNGDIVLFSEETYQLKKLEKGNMIPFASYRWPGGVIPYTIEDGHVSTAQINSAISSINANSNICMVPRTTETNYVEFVDNEQACWSYVGMIGGKQAINVNNCGVGSTIHEICHAAGMWHEQSRNDRDTYVTVFLENVSSGKENNFEIGGESISGVGAYDYTSIMHYGTHFFSKNGLPTIQVKSPPAPPGTTIGQRSTLSSGDIASLNTMYPTRTCGGSNFLTVSPTNMNVGSTAQSQTFSITSDVSWTISESLSWVTVSATSGSNNQVITVDFSANTSTSSRTGTITVSGTGVSSVSISVTQSGAPVPCAVPGSLSELGKGYSWFAAGWNAVTDATSYSWRYKRTTDAAWVTNDSWSGTNVLSSVRVPCTPYTFQVRAVCGSSFSNWSPELTITTEGCGDPYCYSYGIAFGDWISRVDFSNISNSTESDYGYENFTSTTGNVTKGQSYPITLVSGNGSSSQGNTYYWSVWIDFNRDNDFSDAGENVIAQSASKSTSSSTGFTGNIAIPMTASTGLTRMRVAMSLNPNESACANSANYRDVEDYGINIVQPANFLLVSPTSLSFAAAGETKTASVNSSIAWSVSESLSWLSVTPSSGSNDGSLSIQADQNTSTTARNGTITVSGSGVPSQTISVTQAGIPVILTASPTTLNFGASGGDLNLSVSSNIAWTASENLSWLSVSSTSGTGNTTLTLTATENPSAIARAGTLSLSGAGATTVNITINQSGSAGVLTVAPTTLDFPSSAGSLNLAINSNTNWTATENLAWISLNSTTGSNNGTLTVTASQNTSTSARSGTLTLTGTGASPVVITINQAGSVSTISASPTTLNFTFSGGDKSFAVTSNSSWSASSNQSWALLNMQNGTGNGNILVTTVPNPTVNSRTAEITLSTSGASPVTVTVVQAAAPANLSASLLELSFAAAGNGLNFDITSNTSWTASENLSWLTLSSTSGTGNSTLTATAAANTSTSVRTGTITLSAAGATSLLVFVAQAGAAGTLTATPSTLNFNAAGGGLSIGVTSNISWTASESLSWLTLSSTSGTSNATITATATENTSTSTRNGTITLSGSGVTSVVLNITQAAGAASLSVTPLTLNFSASGGGLNLGVTSNISWTASENLSWLTLSSTSGTGNTTLTATATQNTSTSPRSGTITLSGSGVSAVEVNVTQSGAALTLTATPSTLNFTAAGGGLNIGITSNISWTASESLSWLTLSSTSGTGNTTLTATAAENTSTSPRSGTITLSGSGVSPVEISITQSGVAITLSASPTSLNFNTSGGSLNLDIASNASWTATENISWITLSNTSGNGNSTLTVTASENALTTTRSGTLTLSAPGTGSVAVTITQSAAAAFLTATPLTLDFTAAGGALNIEINANTTWTATEGLSWLSLSGTSGSGGTTLVATALENTSTSTRSGTLTLNGNGTGTVVVTINQAAATPFLSAAPTTLNFSASGGNLDLAINSNVSWTASENLSWLTLNSTSGSGNGVLNLVATENSSTAVRSGAITLNGAGTSQVVVTITQAGAAPVLTATPTTLNFTPTGGTLNIEISSNTTWTASESISWLTLGATSGSGSSMLATIAEENTSTSPRSGSITLNAPGVSPVVLLITQAGAAPFLSASPSTLSFGSAGGSLSLNINSNTVWTANESLAWLSISASSSSGNGTLTVTATVNPTVVSRNGVITISGPGVPAQTVTINQAAAPAILSIDPDSLNFGPQADSQVIQIVSNTDWTIVDTTSWIAMSKGAGQGNDQVTARVEVNPGLMPRIARIGFLAGNVQRIIHLIQAAPDTSLPDTWRIQPTSRRHLVRLPAQLSVNLGGKPLQAGDRLGVFFKSGGVEKSAGSVLWTGKDVVLEVFGNDPATSGKEGLEEGERMVIKIWQAREQETWETRATFAPVSTIEGVNAGDRFRTGGISKVEALRGFKTEVLSIPVNRGWNTISSFVRPEEPHLDSLMLPYSSWVESMRDGVGKIFISSSGVNNIGGWNVEEGYRLRAGASGTIQITGEAVDPESTPIPIRTGWQLIAFFSRVAQHPRDAFESMSGRIDMVKDNAGRIYLPSLSINTIGRLQPTQGYHVRSRGEGELRFPNSWMVAPGVKPPGDVRSSQNETPVYFQRPAVSGNTGVNATIVIPVAVVNEILVPGDEVGVYSPQNLLCGSAVFDGSPLAIAVWGDDAGIPGLQGMRSGDRYQLKVWKHSEKQVYGVERIDFASGNDQYQENDLEIVEQLMLTREPLGGLQSRAVLQVFPNPGRDFITVLPGKTLPGESMLRLFDVSGRLVYVQQFMDWTAGSQQTIRLTGIPAGTYVLQLAGADDVWTEKVQIME